MTDEPAWTPFPPYAAAGDLTSSGRVSLARATTEYCLLHWGMDEADVAAALAVDDPEGEADRFRVLGAVRLFGRLFADGVVRTFARRFGGGSPVPLASEVWELDDYRPRFLHCALALDAPWDVDVPPTHWILVDEQDWREVLERSCAEHLPRSWRTRGRQAETGQDEGDAAGGGSTAASESFLRLPEVKARTGLARSTIYARIGRGAFPRQVDLDGNVAAWRETEVADWMASRG